VRNDYFNAAELARWIGSAIWASLAIFFLVYWMFEGADSTDGRISGQWSVATAAYTYVVIVVNFRLATVCNYLTFWHHFFIWGSILFWLFFAFIYNGLKPEPDSFPPRSAFSVFGLIQYLFGTSRFYLGALLCVPASLLPDMAYQAFQRYANPMDYQIVQEMAANQLKAKDTSAAAMFARRKAADAEAGDAEAGDGKPSESGAFVGGIEGVSGGKPHTGYAFEHPGFEGTMTLFTGGKEGEKIKAAQPSASDKVNAQAAQADNAQKRKTSVFASEL